MTETSNFEDKVLLSELKRWRTEKSLSIGLPAYTILKDKTLNEIVEKRPENFSQLKRITGIGEIVLEKYGNDLLKIVKNHSKIELEEKTSNESNQGKQWTQAEDDELIKEFLNKSTLEEMARNHKRTKDGIKSRIHKIYFEKIFGKDFLK